MHKMSKIVKDILYKFSKKIIFLNKYDENSYKLDKTGTLRRKIRRISGFQLPDPGLQCSNGGILFSNSSLL